MATTFVTLVLDESGSMEDVRDKTIAGFNEYLHTLQQDEETDYRFSLLKFDSNHQTFLHVNTPVEKVRKLDRETYKPGAGTPLYDAVGKAITQASHTELGKKDRVFVAILTDGYENQSIEFNAKQLANMIKEREATDKWAFVYLGADQNAILEAAKFGINAGQTIAFDSSNTHTVVNALYAGTSGYSKGLTAAASTQAIKTAITTAGDA